MKDIVLVKDTNDSFTQFTKINELGTTGKKKSQKLKRQIANYPV